MGDDAIGILIDNHGYLKRFVLQTNQKYLFLISINIKWQSIKGVGTGSMLRKNISERHQFLIVKSNLNFLATRTLQTVRHRFRAGTFWSRHTLVILKLPCYIFACSPSWTGYWCFIFEHYHRQGILLFFILVFYEGLHGATVSALSFCNNFFVSRPLTLTGAIPMLLFIRAYKSFTNFWIKLMYL